MAAKAKEREQVANDYLAGYQGVLIYELVNRVKIDNKRGSSHNIWHIGREDNPLVIKTKSIHPHATLQYLLSLFPSYNPARSQKDISATVLMQEVDKKLKKEKAGEVINPYQENNLADENGEVEAIFLDDGNVYAEKDNPDISSEANAEDERQAKEHLTIEMEAGEALNNFYALDKATEDSIYEKSVNNDIREWQHEQREAAEAKIIEMEESGYSKADIKEKKNKLEDDSTEACSEDEIDFTSDDDVSPAGQRESSSLESTLANEEGLNVSDNDLVFSGYLSQGVREEYKKSIPDYEKELSKSEKKLNKEIQKRAELKEKSFDAVLNGGMKAMKSAEGNLTRCHARIKKIEGDIKNTKHILSVLKRNRVDDKDSSSGAEKQRDTARTNIRRALKEIKSSGEAGGQLETYIRKRINTSDPISYAPQKGDLFWSVTL